MLCLEAEAVTQMIGLLSFPRRGILQKIPCVKLNAGLSCEYLHYASRRFFDNFRCGPQLSRSSVQHKVVIVTLSELQLLVRFDYMCSNRGRLCKVKRRTFNTSNFAGGN